MGRDQPKKSGGGSTGARRSITEALTYGFLPLHEWFELLDFAKDNKIALVDDFRRFYGLSWSEVGIGFTWEEAYYHFTVLKQKSDSWTHAIISEWECPVSEEWIVLTNLLELTQWVNYSGKGKKPKPPWRPWDKVEKKKNATSVGSIAHLPESEKRKVSEQNKRFIDLMRSGKLLQQEGIVIKELPSDMKF